MVQVTPRWVVYLDRHMKDTWHCWCHRTSETYCNCQPFVGDSFKQLVDGQEVKDLKESHWLEGGQQKHRVPYLKPGTFDTPGTVPGVSRIWS